MIARPIVLLISCAMLCGAAKADVRLTIHYEISMIGVAFGQISWAIDIGAGSYITAASGKASGALNMLVNGEGRIATRGVIAGENLIPSFFSYNVTDDGQITGLQMTFENGAVKTLRTDAPLRKDGRKPVSEADRQGVTDPLSAMLIAAPPGESALAPARCGRALAIFDGQRRYNLALSYKRIDSLKIGAGYAGPVLVCAVMLEPIAGYREDSLLVKYVSRRRDMEIWFAPIAGTAMIAPARLVMPTMIGTLEIVADRIDFVAAKPTPEPAKPEAPPK
jgi:hypothetical protein